MTQTRIRSRLEYKDKLYGLPLRGQQVFSGYPSINQPVGIGLFSKEAARTRRLVFDGGALAFEILFSLNSLGIAWILWYREAWNWRDDRQFLLSSESERTSKSLGRSADFLLLRSFGIYITPSEIQDLKSKTIKHSIRFLKIIEVLDTIRFGKIF